MNGAGEEKFDVVIIGGGAIGLSCAWRMASRGVSVAVFDRLQVGREASYAAGGMLAPSCEGALHPGICSAEASAAMRSLCFASRDLYPAFANELAELTGVDIELSLRAYNGSDWREPGILFVSETEKDPRIDQLLEDGLSAKWRDAPAVYLPDDGQVDPRKLLEALKVAALNAGVQICEHRMVRRLEMEGDKVVGVCDDKGVTSAERVLLCAGAWCSKIGGVPREITDSIRPIGGQMVQVRGERRLRHLIYSDGCYLIPRRDGRLLIGATSEDIGFTKRVTAGGVAQLLTAACQLVPELLDAPLESHWAGLRPVTRDGLPMLGPTSTPNLFVAAGHGRNGILLTPATANLIADMLLEGKNVPSAFSATRFLLPVV